MKSILEEKDCTDAALAGNKAARLAELKAAGFRVPPFFVIAGGPGEAGDADLQQALARAVRPLVRDGTFVAVRSSSVDEDGAEQSFAGQYSSFLNVPPEDILAHARRVSESANSEHIAAYRAAQGGAAAPAAPAVLVQRMVPADAAGVAFSADPVSGDRGRAVVAAVAGLGESLVSGECQGDTWHIAARGRIVERQYAGTRPVLSDREARKVAALARAAGAFFGRPQDIEWALAGGRLYLLQSRDITALAAAGSGAEYALWDNSNIVESYGGVTTPLTFSVARTAYREVYRHFGRVLGISERVIERHAGAYEQMIGLIEGRVYYNLLNWYRLLMLTPGFRFNRRFMEQMMGVTEGLPPAALPAPQDDAPLARLRAAAGLARVALGMLARHLRHASRVRRFHRDIDELLRPVELASLTAGELLDRYEALEAAVIPAWDTPLLNDLYCMICHGFLRALCRRWLPEPLAGVHNELLGGAAGMISMEPVHRMRELAALAAADPSFVRTLRAAPLAAIRRHPGMSGDFAAGLERYVARFGDRCLDELKLESPTLADDPLPLLRAVGHLAGAPAAPGGRAPGARDPRLAVAEALAGHPLRRRLFACLLRLAQDRVRDRENLRFERTRVYGRVRSLFLEIGKRLHSLGVLDARDDIFYLDAREVAGIVRGTGSSCCWAEVVRCRRREFAAYAASEGPPRRFATRGPAQLGASRQPLAAAAPADGGAARRGEACSPGIVRGPVRIVRDPRRATIREGEILVAERTDPGWVMLFPLVSGMVMERGSLLSHSAIVAREMGIPAVVGLADACAWLKDGDWVEIDGASGRVQKLEAGERAA